VISEISAEYPAHGGLEILHLELDSLESVSAAAADFLRRSDQLNLLINNAGVMATPYQKTKDGYEYQFGVNHLGHFLLFQKLLPILLKSSTPEFNSRVIALTSSGHMQSSVDLTDLHWEKRGYDPQQAYGQSKTANIWFAREVERRYSAQGLHAWAVHPGTIATELHRHTTLEYWVKRGLFNENGELLWKQLKRKSTAQGAATTIWAAIGKDLEGQGGEYLEDAHKSQPFKPGAGIKGYAPHAYNDESAKKLWEYSEEVVKNVV